MSVYEGIMKGLEEASEYAEGNLQAKRCKITVQPLQNFKASDIKMIRGGLGMTQVLFAEFMGVSVKTVEAWEAGRNIPDGPSRRILAMAQADPQLPERYHLIAQR